MKSWFGFRLHLVVDADSELPVNYAVTKGFLGEQPIMRELFDELSRVRPDIKVVLGFP